MNLVNELNSQLLSSLMRQVDRARESLKSKSRFLITRNAKNSSGSMISKPSSNVPVISGMPASAKKSGVLVIALAIAVAGCESKTAQDYLDSAQQSMQKGEHAVAKVELKNAITLEPNNVDALSLMGQVRYLEGNFPEALKNLGRAGDLGELSDSAQIFLLSSKNKLGKFSEVIGELEHKEGLSADQQVVLADAYIAARDTTKAAELYGQNLHLTSGLLGVSRIAFMEGEFERALSFAEQAIEKAPASGDARLLAAEIELALNRNEDALASFAKVKELAGGKISGQTGIVRAHLASGDLEKAKTEVDSLATMAKKSVQAHYLSALVNFRAEDFDAAESAIGRVNKLVKSYPPATYLHGAILYRQGKLDRAEKILSREFKNNAADLNVRKLLATIANDKNEPKEVIKLLQPVAAQAADPQIFAMLGTALLRSGEAETGAEALQSAVDLAPDTPELRNQLALGLLSSGKEDEAIEQLNSAVELGDDQFQSAYLLAMVKVREGDFIGANRTVDELISKNADSPIGYHLSGSIAFAQKKVELAKNKWEKALSVDANYFPAAQNLARLEMEDGKVDAAKAIYQKLVDSAQGNERAQLALVDIAVSQSEITEALQLVEQATQRWPNSGVARIGEARLLMATGKLSAAHDAVEKAIELSGENSTTLLLKADIEARNGDRKEALRTTKKLQALTSKDYENVELLSAVGQMQFRLGELTRARSNLRRAVELSDDKNVKAQFALTKLELADGNLREAERGLEKLSALKVKGEQFELLRGDIMVGGNHLQSALKHFESLSQSGSRVGTSRAALVAMQLKKHETAEKILGNWLEKYPEDKGMKSLLATAQVQSGDQQSAKVQYEAMLPTNDPVILNNLAWIYMTEGNPKSLEYARKAAKAAPNNPDIEDTLGWILVGEGKLDEGLKYLRSSAKARPANAAVQYHLGVAYQKNGDVENAKKALQKAVELGNFNELDEAKKALELLSAS